MRLTAVKFLGFTLALLVIAVATQPAKAAYSITFTNATTGPNVAPGQIAVTLSDLGSGKVRFTFENKAITGSVVSHITSIGFDDESLFSSQAPVLTPSPGVVYETDNNQSVFNNFNNFSRFILTNGFEPTTSKGTDGNGIDVGQYLSIDLGLTNGNTYETVKTSLKSRDVSAGGLRIAFHLQGIGQKGDSSKFFSTGGRDISSFGDGDVTATPAPAGLVLLGTAMPFVFGLRRWVNRRAIAA